MFKSGFINILGLPNAGKSSIINRLLGENFSIITSKAQTTRHRAYGIINGKNHQAIISDTPGFTRPTNKIHEYMNKKILESFKDADMILLIIELGVKSESNNKLVDKINKSKIPTLLVLNKVDKVNQTILEKEINYWKSELNNIEIWVISAKENFNVENLKNRLIELLPIGPKYFPDDTWTDKNERFFVNEIIREKILMNFKKEIPYSVEVITESFEEGLSIIKIRSIIMVERTSQKGIIIGHKGDAIKRVGTQARIDMEVFFNKKIFLDLQVKVNKNWRSSDNQLKRFGYNQK